MNVFVVIMKWETDHPVMGTKPYDWEIIGIREKYCDAELLLENKKKQIEETDYPSHNPKEYTVEIEEHEVL